MSRVSTTTNKKLMAGIVDTVLEGNTLATRMLTSAKKWPASETIKKTIKVSKNTNGSSFDGFDTFTTAAINNRQTLEFAMKFYEIGSTLPLTEITKNQADPARIADLRQVELEGAAEDMADDIGTLFYEDGTGNSSKDFQGLEAIIDDGTNVATYGGLTRSSYDGLDSTVTASGGTLSLAKLDTLNDAVSYGSVEPTIIYTTPTIFSLYGQLLQSQERINKVGTQKAGLMKGMGLQSGTGFTALSYRGIPVVRDDKCTSGVMYMVNEKYLDWNGATLAETNPVDFTFRYEGNDYPSGVKGFGFSWSNWIIPSNQAAVISHIYLGGQMWSANNRSHGKLTGITAI